MGKLADYLSDTFRAPNKDEWAYEWRRFRQRMIILAIVLIFCAICGGLYGLSRLSENLIMQGTWVLKEDYEDGFQSDDNYLEFKGRECYRSGKRFGRVTQQDDKLIIPFTTAFGRRNRTLSFHGDTLTVEYTGSTVPVTLPVNGNEIGSPYGSGSGNDILNQIIHANRVDTTIVDTYVRISTECDLTEEQRDALY